MECAIWQDRVTLTSMPSSPDLTHHLFRVRIHKNVWSQLNEIARAESRRTGQHVSVSDLARYAINDWITGHEAAARYGSIKPPGGDGSA